MRWRDRMDEHVPQLGAALLADQAQVDPVAVVDALTEAYLEAGGLLHEDSGSPTCRAGDRHPRPGPRSRFAKVEPQRSYVVVLEGAIPPHPMLLSAG